jgi:hypothetical protein
MDAAPHRRREASVEPSKHRTCATVTAALASAVLVLGMSAGVSAQEPEAPSRSAAALLAALGSVPDSIEVRQDLVSWLDQDALVAARPGVMQPASGEELVGMLDSGSPSGELLAAALMGASSGYPDLLQRLASASRWPDELGFDLVDVDSHLTFGRPPADSVVLLGAFDPKAVAAALGERGYTASETAGHVLLCGAAGCEHGHDVDLADADPGLLFGAELGRSEPLAVAPGGILSSADLATVTAMLEAAEGSAASLADDPAYRAVASAADPGARLIQATLLPGGMLGLDPTIFAAFSESPAAAGELVVALDESFEEMPAADVIAVLDGATSTEQVVTIALAYADEADAVAAAEILPRRFEALPSLSTGLPLAAMLTDLGVTSTTGRAIPGTAAMSPSAIVEVRAPLAGSDTDDHSGRLEPSSSLYRLFVDLVLQRDVLWLAPVLPLE